MTRLSTTDANNTIRICKCTKRHCLRVHRAPSPVCCAIASMSSFSSYRSNLNDSEKRPAEGGQWRSRNSIHPFQGQPLKANNSWGQGDPTRERGWREKDYQGSWGARSGNDFQATSSLSIQTPSFSTASHALPEHRHKKPRREQHELKPSTPPPFEPTWPVPQSLFDLLLTPPNSGKKFDRDNQG